MTEDKIVGNDDDRNVRDLIDNEKRRGLFLQECMDVANDIKEEITGNRYEMIDFSVVDKGDNVALLAESSDGVNFKITVQIVDTRVTPEEIAAEMSRTAISSAIGKVRR